MRRNNLRYDPFVQNMKTIAYSLDALIPGFYLWCGPIKIRLGGSSAEDNYSGTIHTLFGAAIVLPRYKLYSTYQGSHDRNQSKRNRLNV